MHGPSENSEQIFSGKIFFGLILCIRGLIGRRDCVINACFFSLLHRPPPSLSLSPISSSSPSSSASSSTAKGNMQRKPRKQGKKEGRKKGGQIGR